MKTTVKFCFVKSKLIHGTGKLQMRVTRQRKTSTITTPYILYEDEWDEKKQKIIINEKVLIKRKKELISINSKLQKDKQLINKTVELLESRGDYSAKDILQNFSNSQHGVMFCEYVNSKVEYLKKANRFGTAEAYKYAAVSFLKFLGKKDIDIYKINAALIKSYEQYLFAENKQKNTISCYMRSLRAVYNQAVHENIISKKKTKSNPFSGAFTGNAKTGKRAIGVDSILKMTKVKAEDIKCSYKRLEKTKLNSISKSITLPIAIDVFMFSLYTQGMSFSDIVNLKKENIKGDFIRYKRKKTGQQITIGMEDCTMEIIKRYSDKNSNYIFPILRSIETGSEYLKWKKTNLFLARYNKSLKKLARYAGIDEHLTSYVARHSWASIASQEGISIATISKGMGHESEKTTRIYISQLDYSDVGRANKRILSRFTG